MIRSTTRERLFPLLGCPQVAMQWGTHCSVCGGHLLHRFSPLCFVFDCRCCDCFDCCHPHRQIAMGDQLISLQWPPIAQVLVFCLSCCCWCWWWWTLCESHLLRHWKFQPFVFFFHLLSCLGVITNAAAIGNNVGQVYEIFVFFT